MKRLVISLIILIGILNWEVLIKGYVPVPADTLVGAYYPWLDSNWGFPTGVPVKNPLISDVFSQFFIWKHQSTDQLLHHLSLPLWDHTTFMGTPLLATFHSTVLFPANILFLLPKYTGWSLYICFSTLFSALCLALYLRRYISSLPAIISGSLVFALSGPMTTWAEFGTGVWSAGFLPLSLYAIDKILLDHQSKYLSLLTISTLCLCLSGHVQLLTYYFLLIPLYIIFISFKKIPLQQIFPLAIFILLGLGLASIQLIPSFEFFLRSIRGLENYSASFNFGLINLFDFIRLWAADFFGSPVTYNVWNNISYHEYSSFLGTLSLPLILSTVTRKITGVNKFFILVFIVCLLLVLNQPFSRLLFSLPLPLLTYSSASRLLFLVSLSAGILVAFSLQQIFNSVFSHRRLLIFLILLIVIHSLAYFFIVPDQSASIALRNSVLPVFILLFSALLLLLFSPRPKIIILIFALIIIGDLSRYYRKYNPFVPSSIVFPSTKVIDFLTANTAGFRVATLNSQFLPPNTWSMYGLSAPTGYNPLYLLSYDRFFNLLNNQQYFNTPSRYAELTGFRPKFLNAASVKYLIGSAELSTLYPQFPVVFTSGKTHIIENLQVQPLSYFVINYSLATTESQLADKLESSTFDPQSEAVFFPSTPLLPASLSQGQVTSKSFAFNHASISTSSTSSGILVISQSFDPGWQATIDNEPVTLWQVNAALTALIVPPGDHHIYLKYFPSSLIIGTIISSLSLIAFLGLSRLRSLYD